VDRQKLFYPFPPALSIREKLGLPEGSPSMSV